MHSLETSASTIIDLNLVIIFQNVLLQDDRIVIYFKDCNNGKSVGRWRHRPIGGKFKFLSYVIARHEAIFFDEVASCLAMTTLFISV
ncbi:MAG: hypothetical protein EOO86_07320 [Pedobacter sp.]|nr:MAG: hypothetical protein EOO86_07320 [Pedobacter sp.]